MRNWSQLRRLALLGVIGLFLAMGCAVDVDGDEESGAMRLREATGGSQRLGATWTQLMAPNVAGDIEQQSPDFFYRCNNGGGYWTGTMYDRSLCHPETW